MALDASQLAAYKADILANTDPVIVQALSDGANNVITNWYNEDVSPDYWIYRDMVPTENVRDAINANDLVNITTADSDRVIKLLSVRQERGFSGADADDRAAWDDVFSAAAGDKSQQAIAALWTRTATNIEKLFSLSTGSGVDAANADTTSFQGAVTLQDTRDALALP